MNGKQKKHEEKITRDVEKEGKAKGVNKSNINLPLTEADFL